MGKMEVGPSRPEDILKQGTFLPAGNIRGGTITGREIILAGGTRGVLRSENFDPDVPTGWALFGDGTLKLMGDLFLGGNISLLSGGKLSILNDSDVEVGYINFTTSTTYFSGDITFADDLLHVNGKQYSYTGFSETATVAGDWNSSYVTLGLITGDTTSTGGLAFGTDVFLDPQSLESVFHLHRDYSGDSIPPLQVAWSDSTPDSGVTLEISQIGLFLLDGSATAPAYSFINDTNTGLFRATTDALGFTTAGTEWWRLGSGGNLRSMSTGVLRITDGSASSPGLGFESDTDSGLYRDSADTLAIATNGVERVRISTTGFSVAAAATGAARLKVDSVGGMAAPTYGFVGDADTGMYRKTADQVALVAGGDIAAYFRDGGSSSSVAFQDGLTDVGNHETLRLNRGTGTTDQFVGYYSSWAYTKTDIRPLSNTPWWNREWFMDIETISSRKKKNTEAFRGQEDMRTISFLMDNLIENTNLLTTKGIRVGDEPDLHAILAVTVDYVQHLEERLAALEAKVAALV